MPTIQELLAQKDELDKRIEAARIKERNDALATVRELVSTFGFTMQQAFPLPQTNSKKRTQKYYDPATGKSWSGLGKPPKWIADKDRRQFEIEAAPEEQASIQFTTPSDPSNPFPIQ